MSKEPDVDFIETPPRTQVLYVPHRLDGLNEIIKEARTHWSKGAKNKGAQDELVMWAIRECKIKQIAGSFRMELHFSEPNDKRDPDNIVAAKKFILDALKKMNIIKDDNQKFVEGWSETWGLATPEQPVGVYIKLIED